MEGEGGVGLPEAEHEVTEPGRRVTEPGRRVTEPDRRVTEPGRKVTEPGRKVTEPAGHDRAMLTAEKTSAAAMKRFRGR